MVRWPPPSLESVPPNTHTQAQKLVILNWPHSSAAYSAWIAHPGPPRMLPSDSMATVAGFLTNYNKSFSLSSFDGFR